MTDLLDERLRELAKAMTAGAPEDSVPLRTGSEDGVRGRSFRQAIAVGVAAAVIVAIIVSLTIMTTAGDSRDRSRVATSSLGRAAGGADSAAHAVERYLRATARGDFVKGYSYLLPGQRQTIVKQEYVSCLKRTQAVVRGTSVKAKAVETVRDAAPPPGYSHSLPTKSVTVSSDTPIRKGGLVGLQAYEDSRRWFVSAAGLESYTPGRCGLPLPQG
jgi:hypothetical protein